MENVRAMFFVAFCLFFLDGVTLLENGLALLPPMGWMSWGYYMCADDCEKEPHKCLDEKLIMAVADAFFSEGYQEAGYEYIIIDDCWSELRRSSESHRLVPDKKRFPRGMKFLADYIHARGLKFGMYLNIAQVTCMNYPGSRDHFKIDAKTFASWDVDYVKVDGCFVEESYLDQAYIKLGFQLNMTGRPMVYGCSWPYYKKYIHKHDPDYTQMVPVCNLWRNFHDIAINWGNVRYIIDFYEQNATFLKQFHGPGHWNDPDMLILGTSALTPGQSRVQMAVWAMLSAPMLISCDMSKISPYEKLLLQNLDLLAVAQDPKGIMATPFKLTRDVTLWVKPHLPMKGDAYYSYSFAIVNLSGLHNTVYFKPKQYGLNSTVIYTVLGVFSGKMLRNVTIDDDILVSVPSEDVVMYTLYPL